MRKRRVLLVAFMAFLGNIKAFPPSYSLPSSKVSTEHKIALEVLPGPVNKELTISFTEATSHSTITVTDLKGTKILSQSVDVGATRASINVSKLDSGTYFVVLSNAEGRTSKLFIKQ